MSTASTSSVRVVIVPGMGCHPTRRANWYHWLSVQLQAIGVQCVCEDYPDQPRCREKYWIPFMRDKLKVDEHCILVGHSTGSEAILRYLESHKVAGAIIVSAYHSDLGDESERASGYFDRPWDWAAIRANTPLLVQYHSIDDDLVPVTEARLVAQETQAEYIEHADRGHFMYRSFPDLFERLKRMLKQ